MPKKGYLTKAVMRKMIRNYLKNNDISIMRDMMSVLLEGALDEEPDEKLGYSKYDYRNKETDNSRNGHSNKTMHTCYGDTEEKILSMYAKGMTTGDIESHMCELYDIDISDSTVSRITDKILPIVKE